MNEPRRSGELRGGRPMGGPRPPRRRRGSGPATLLFGILAILFFFAVLYMINKNLDSKSDSSSKQKTQMVAEDSDQIEQADTEAVKALTGDGLTVTFLDVGQGNAILFACDGEYLLYDGGPDKTDSYVMEYLKEQEIGELTYVVSSHYDSDHVSGLIEVLQELTVDTILDADYVHDSKTYELFLEAVEENGGRELHPAVGDSYSLGQASFTVVCPDSYDHSDSNENSIGIRLVYGETSFLICGDAPASMEDWMIDSGENLESTVYVCSHHGSASSNSADFLMEVVPEYVVISCGLDNSYGHPHEEVMELLESMEIDLYRTDLQGTISVTSDGQNLTWNQAACTDYSDGD